MLSPKEDKLSKIKQRLQGQSKGSIATEYFVLAKELGCLGELLGREFEVQHEIEEVEITIKIWKWKIPIRWKQHKLVGFKQLPIPIPTFITLMQEFKTYKEMEEKQMKKGKGKKR